MPWAMCFCRFVALCALQSLRCSCKVVRTSITIGGTADSDSQWRYLSKFGSYRGLSTYAIRVKRHTEASKLTMAGSSEVGLSVEVHLDEEWEQNGGTEHLPACERKSKSRRVWPITVPPSDWGIWVNGTLEGKIREHVWYFALRDCEQTFPTPVQLDVEFYANQPGGSEFPVELYGTLPVAAGKAVLGGLFAMWFVRHCKEVQISSGRLHPVIKVLLCAVLSQCVSYVFQWLHLRAYEEDGQGVQLFSVISEVSSMLSQIIITSLSLFLAQGYTILPNEGVSLGLTVVASVCVVVAHLLLVCIAKLRDDASFKFHESEGSVGMILVTLRLALYFWFCFSMRRTFAGASNKLQPFLIRFFFASSVYYLSYPILVLIARVLAPYLRHKFMLAGVFFMQAWSFSWYTQMFLTRGLYFEISSLGANFLPTPQGSRNNRPQMFTRERPNIWDKSQ